MTNKKSLKYHNIRRVFSTEEDEEENYDSEDVPLKPKANDTETEDSDSDKVKVYAVNSTGDCLYLPWLHLGNRIVFCCCRVLGRAKVRRHFIFTAIWPVLYITTVS